MSESMNLEDIMEYLKNVKMYNKSTGKMMSISKIDLEWKDESGDHINIKYP